MLHGVTGIWSDGNSLRVHVPIGSPGEFSGQPTVTTRLCRPVAPFGNGVVRA